ncbi:MAG TPA: response regulator transcription factor [Actinomycetota bacterium]|nr:response regulator transcription factor [Actinomycetota bacterium]
MTGARVLVVDDEPIVREVLSRYLAREGFDVEAAEDGERALSAVERARPDVVILDLMLPRIDGLEVFRRMRDAIPSPFPAVIMLTAKGEETDRIVGLELGADDYVTKPFSPREVVARVRAVLRRTASPAAEGPTPPLRFEDLEIDVERRDVRARGEAVHLTRKEFDLLHLLASNPGVVFKRLQLLEQVWDFAWEGDSSTVTVHIRRIREKIEADPSRPRHLMTIWGVGYRFEP